MSGALAGIKIIEIASYVTGPFASQLLADMGGDVVKIEEPKRGDPFRGWGEKNYSATFCSLNRNKRSLTLDLRHEQAREIVLKLAAQSDVLIQNFRPGVMEKRGLGYEDVRKVNSKLVYCSISGFGAKGPYRDMPGYDTIGQARSGLLSLLTDPGKPQGMGISFSDHLTGMYACYGVLAALMNRMLTGQGQLVETSLLRASVSFIAENAARYFETCPGASIEPRPPAFSRLLIAKTCPSSCTCLPPINSGMPSSRSWVNPNGALIRGLIVGRAESLITTSSPKVCRKSSNAATGKNG
jgi:crotonobetainyl-CoA:carnitine CoA-transferase CaiB-like acyl-CoA transferase